MTKQLIGLYNYSNDYDDDEYGLTIDMLSWYYTKLNKDVDRKELRVLYDRDADNWNKDVHFDTFYGQLVAAIAERKKET